MLRQTFAAMALASIVGCSANSSFHPFASSNSGEQGQLAAYAATARYPDAKPSSDIKAAVLINPRSNTVKVVNFSDEAIRDVNVWVNGSFVHRVGIIPSHGSVVLDREQFYDAAGENMSKVNSTPNRVDLQAGDHLYRLGNVISE
jgi:hypothetical protein